MLIFFLLLFPLSSFASPTPACKCSLTSPSLLLTCSQLESNQQFTALSNTNFSSCDLRIGKSSIRQLVIRDSNIKNFTLSSLSKFRNLTRLTLTRSRIENLMTKASLRLKNVVYLNISENQLVSLSPQLDDVFPSLKDLVLDGNNLTSLPNGTYDFLAMRSVTLLDNPWSCDGIYDFVQWVRTNPNVTVRDSNNTFCHYKLARTPETEFELKPIRSILEDCPENCSCRVFRNYMIVNCDGQNYLHFPPALPPETYALHLANNSIRSIGSLLLAPATYYSSLTFLYLENNYIDSLSEIEGQEDAFKKVVTLHIAGNKLTRLPIHIFERLLVNKLEILSLSQNPWSCDCEPGSELQRLIQTYHRAIIDRDEVRCADNDRKHPNRLLIQLTKLDLCAVPEAGIHPLDVLNGCLALLIMLIIAKLAYDYRYMQRTGQLPVGPYSFCQMLRFRSKR